MFAILVFSMIVGYCVVTEGVLRFHIWFFHAFLLLSFEYEIGLENDRRAGTKERSA